VIVKTWCRSEVEIAWWNLPRWWRWALGHLRHAFHTWGQRLDERRSAHRWVAANEDLHDHIHRCKACGVLPDRTIAMEDVPKLCARGRALAAIEDAEISLRRARGWDR